MVVNIISDWAEAFAFWALVVGFVMSLSAPNVVYIYVLVVLVGLAFGRLFFRYRDKVKAPLFLSILGFLAGFLLGSFRADLKVVIFLYVASIYFSYFVHEKKLIKSLEF